MTADPFGIIRIHDSLGCWADGYFLVEFSLPSAAPSACWAGFDFVTYA